MGSHISIEEAATRLGVRPEEIEASIERGDLPALEVGNSYRIHKRDFKRWSRAASSRNRAFVVTLLVVGLFAGVGSAVGFELGQNESGRITNDIPRVLPFEGSYALDGQPVNGSTPMSFSLYEQSVGGTPVWSSSNRMVTLDDGRFAVALGDANDATPIPEAVFASTSLYLEVITEGNALSPRQRLAPAPQAVSAARAATDFDVPGALSVEGQSNLDALTASSLQVQGNANVAGTLISTGRASFNADVNLGDDPNDITTVAGDLMVEGKIPINSVNGGGPTSMVGHVCGATAPTTGLITAAGNTLKGYEAAKELCEQVSGCGDTAHMCTLHELNLASQRGWVPSTTNSWISGVFDQTEKDTSVLRVDDCVGWAFGGVDDGTTGGKDLKRFGGTIRSEPNDRRVLSGQECNQSLPILCCD